MHPTVLALKEVLATTTKAVQVVNAPTTGLSSDAVSIWAWRVGEDASLRQRAPDGRPLPAAPVLRISCLVFAADLEALELARAAVFHQPMVASPGGQVSIQYEPLDSTLLLSLFMAARLEPRPCLSYVLRAVAA